LRGFAHFVPNKVPARYSIPYDHAAREGICSDAGGSGERGSARCGWVFRLVAGLALRDWFWPYGAAEAQTRVWSVRTETLGLADPYAGTETAARRGRVRNDDDFDLARYGSRNWPWISPERCMWASG